MLSQVVTPRPPLRALFRLEPYAVKVARTVLRGGGGSNVVSLPDFGITKSSVNAILYKQLAYSQPAALATDLV